MLIWWPMIYRFSGHPARFDHKVQRNFVSFCHCISTVFLFRDHTFIYANTLSYFLWDTYLSFSYASLSELAYIVHHLLAMILMSPVGGLPTEVKARTIVLFEMSNIPNYIMYDLLKSNPSKDYISMRIFQLLWYGYFRLMKIPLYLYDNNEHYNNLTIYQRVSLTTVLFMGYVWTFFMLRGIARVPRRAQIEHSTRE